jgi:putative MATE family efflux protein
MFFATPAFQLLGAEAGVVKSGAPFLRLFLLTLPIHYFVIVLNSCLRGAGDTRTPFLVIIIETLVRILFAWILVNGLLGMPVLNASGVAIGALVGQFVGAGVLTFLLWRGRLLLKLRLMPRQLDLPLTRVLLKLGIPSGAEQLGLRLGQVINVRLITGLGTVGFAAYLVGFNSISLALAVGVGFAMAATTIVGQSIGAGRPLDAREGAKQTWIFGMIALGAIGILLYLGAERIISAFTTDEEVIALAVFPLKVVALILPAEATNQVLSGAFRGAGDTRWPFLLTTAGNFLLRIPLTVVLMSRFGLMGVWIALMIEISVRAGLNAWRFLRLDWRTSVDPVSIGAPG